MRKSSADGGCALLVSGSGGMGTCVSDSSWALGEDEGIKEFSGEIAVLGRAVPAFAGSFHLSVRA